MQLLVPVALIQQDFGIFLDRIPAPQPLGPSGPMDLDHPMTTGIQDVDLIPSLVVKMNKHEVPSYYGSLANNTTKGITKWINNLWGRIQHCQHTRNLSEFIAKQVLCRPDSYSKQEPNVRSLWPGKKTMVSFSPPRLFAAWRVEAPLSAGSLSDGFHALRSL